MKAKIGSQEWIDNVTKHALDNRANQLDPNNIRFNAKPAKEAACQSVTAFEYGILAAGIATGLAIAGVAALAYKHLSKKNEEAEDAPQDIIDIPQVIVSDGETVQEAA